MSVLARSDGKICNADFPRSKMARSQEEVNTSQWPLAEEFFLRANLAPSRCLLERIQEFAKRRLSSNDSSSTSTRAAPFQGYCSYTLLAGEDSLVQFRPPRHELSIYIAHDAQEVFGLKGREAEEDGETQHGYDSGYSDGGEENDDSKLRDLLNVPRRPRTSRRKQRPRLNKYQTDIDLGEISVPLTQDLGVLEGLHTLDGQPTGQLHAYLLTFVPGQSLTSLHQTRTITLPERKSLIRDFAAHFATSLTQSRSWDDPWLEQRKNAGKVSSSLDRRVDMMLRDLPSELRPLAQKVKDNLEAIKRLPWALTHGDLVPDNIHVDEGGRLCGLVDWAEGEWLPLGVGMYGVEYLLGEFRYDVDNRVNRFVYYDEADGLREYFWDEFLLRTGLSSVRDCASTATRPASAWSSGEGDVLERIKLARIFGLLLWNGIAFDDGRLDRVVDEGDVEEFARLKTLLPSM